MTGAADRPIIYQVERIRDGESFCTRSVKAVQKGEVILMMQVSFMKTEASNLDYQFVMPQVPAPDQVKTLDQVLRDYLVE